MELHFETKPKMLSGGWVQTGPIKGGERLQVRDDRHAFMTVVKEKSRKDLTQ